MILRSTGMTSAVICTALGLSGLAHASQPPCRSPRGQHRPQSLASEVLVRAPSLALRSRFRVASLEAVGDASPVGTPSQRSAGLTWDLLQSVPREWTDSQPITLAVGFGPSNPRYGGVRGNRSLVDATAAVTSTTAATGWTRPLGMRLSIRW